MKSCQMNSPSSVGRKKIKRVLEINNSKVSKIKSNNSKRMMKSKLSNSKSKLTILKTKMRWPWKRIRYLNKSRSIWGSKLRRLPSRRPSSMKHLIKAKLKLKKILRRWRKPWWPTITIKLILSQLKSVSNRPRRWQIWELLLFKIFNRSFSSWRLKNSTNY